MKTTISKDRTLNASRSKCIKKFLYYFPGGYQGKNFICVIDWNQMGDYIFRRNATTPSFRIIPLEVRVVNGLQVGFSGACILNEQDILFTASLEETTNFIDDGAVKGSYIGMIEVRDDTASITKLMQLKDDKGGVILDKLESIDIYSKTDSMISAIAVADNDNGSSKIFMVEIRR